MPWNHNNPKQKELIVGRISAKIASRMVTGLVCLWALSGLNWRKRTLKTVRQLKVLPLGWVHTVRGSAAKCERF